MKQVLLEDTIRVEERLSFNCHLVSNIITGGIGL